MEGNGTVRTTTGHWHKDLTSVSVFTRTAKSSNWREHATSWTLGGNMWEFCIIRDSNLIRITPQFVWMCYAVCCFSMRQSKVFVAKVCTELVSIQGHNQCSDDFYPVLASALLPQWKHAIIGLWVTYITYITRPTHKYLEIIRKKILHLDYVKMFIDIILNKCALLVMFMQASPGQSSILLYLSDINYLVQTGCVCRCHLQCRFLWSRSFSLQILSLLKVYKREKTKAIKGQMWNSQ